MDIIQRFERRVFHYGIILAVVVRLIRLIHEVLIDSPISILLLGSFSLILFVAVLYLYPRNFHVAFFIFFFQTLINSVLTWHNAGGWNGSVPYVLLVLVMAVVITSHGLPQVVMLFAYALVIILFAFTSTLDSFSVPNANYSLFSREFDFLIGTFLLILLTFYLKENFLSYRESIELTNLRLTKSTEKLMKQNQELYQQQVELNILRNNLERVISGKISESQNQAEILKEYSFINSHHVRAPLARVLGLVDLIQIENHHDNVSSGYIQKIKRDAEELDVILKKMNNVIS